MMHLFPEEEDSEGVREANDGDNDNNNNCIRVTAVKKGAALAATILAAVTISNIEV